MARYDAGWGRFNRDGYGHGAQHPMGGGGGYDREFGGGAGAGERDSSFTPSLYGPERYGLGPYHERLRGRKRPDQELRKEVEEALFYDTWVDSEAIQVEVKEGVVTLRGALPSYEEVRYATDDAWDVDGVIGVRSEMSVDGR